MAGSRVFFEEFNSFYYYSGSSHSWEMQGYHFHKEYEVILFMCDGATIAIGNRVYTVNKGDLFLINNREYHKTTGVEGQEYRRFVLMFDPGFVQAAEAPMGYSFTRYFENHMDGFLHKIHLSGENLERTVGKFKRIESCYHKSLEEDKIELKLAVLELLVHINRMYGFFASEGTDGRTDGDAPYETAVRHDWERIGQIKNFIKDHLDEKLDLDTIAAHFYISRSYLSHYFKKETGFTLGQYITDQKIMAAKVMLKQGFSVTEAAVALGYHSDSHFIQIFKKMTGTTPKRYAAEK